MHNTTEATSATETELAPAPLPVPTEPVRREPDPPAPSEPRWGWLPVLTTRAALERGRAAEGRALRWAGVAGVALADAYLERECAQELATEVTALTADREALEDELDRARADRRAEAEDARAREEGLAADLRGMAQQLATQRAEIDRLRASAVAMLRERDAARHQAVGARGQMEQVAGELWQLAGREELVVLLHHGRPVGIYTSLGDARADVADLERWVREWEDRDGGEATEAVEYMGEVVWEARGLSRWWAQHGKPEIWTLLIRLRCAQLDGVRLEERQTWGAS